MRLVTLLICLCWLPGIVQAAEFIGHRGARGLYPENSITAFIEAVRMGVDGVELDVVITKDKQVLVSHDPYIDSTLCLKPDGSSLDASEEEALAIYNLTYQQIQAYDCGLIPHQDFPRQALLTAHKPLLKDVIQHVQMVAEDKPVTIYVEIKSTPDAYQRFQPEPKEFVQRVYEVIKTAQVNIMVISFDPAILQEFHQQHPNIPLGLLIYGTEPVDAMLQTLGFVPEAYLPAYQVIDADFIDRIHQLGMRVISWVVNDNQELQRERELGIDGIITDYPNLNS